jgi:pimeloyl-ACP methyl ester carboxylesterase
MSSVILCLHGLGASQESFNRLREVGLGPNRQMIALDFAGFGQRFEDPVSDDPLAAAADEIARDIRQKDYQDIVLIGHSMGGAVALQVADLIADRVFGVVSIEGNLIGEDCGLVSRRLASAADAMACDVIKQELVAATAGSANPSSRAWSADLSKVLPETLLSYSRSLVDVSDSGVLLKSFKKGDYRKLYLHGDGYKGHVLLKRLRPVPIVYVAGAGHNVMYDAPDACAAAIADVVLSVGQ